MFGQIYQIAASLQTEVPIVNLLDTQGQDTRIASEIVTLN